MLVHSISEETGMAAGSAVTLEQLGYPGSSDHGDPIPGCRGSRVPHGSGREAGFGGDAQGLLCCSRAGIRAAARAVSQRCPAQGHFPARPSPGHGGLTPFAAEKQFFGSSGHKCPRVPLVLPTPLWHQPVLWHWGGRGEDVHRARLPITHPTPQLDPLVLCLAPGVQLWDGPISPQPKKLT